MRIRRWFRALACAVFTAVMASATALGVVAAAGSPAGRAAWRDRMTQLWARGLARILGLSIQLEGEPPPRGALLVANHLSYLDIVLLAARIPCGFVAKAEVRSWPGIGLVCRVAGVVFVDRARRRDAPRAASEMHDALAQGRTVILFPEGTSTDGRAVLPFRSALLDGAARSGRPVWCAAVGYRTPVGAPPAESAVCWAGDDAFAPHVWGLLGLPRIEGAIRFAATPIIDGRRKELAQQLWDAVRREHLALAEAWPAQDD